MGNVFSVISAFLSAVATGIAAGIAWRSHRATEEARQTQRTQRFYELIRSLHADLTTGEIRPARDLLGGVVYSGETITSKTLAEYREAYFRILWSFGGIYAGYRVIKKAGDGPSLEFFRELIGWHIDEWSRNIVGEPALRRKIDEAMRAESSELHDTNSLLRLQELCDEFGTFTWPQYQRVRPDGDEIADVAAST